MAIARYLDKVYLFIVGTQLFGMLALDLVQFYPKALWDSPSAPLHFLVTLKAAYTSYSGDPFFAEPAHEPWFQACILIEGLLGAEALDPAKKASLLWGTYFPFTLIPVLMAVDMHFRILARISNLEKKVKSQ
ncbi:unnamed protein product [Clonostachys rosea f. rosea IK726]|uniref:EXPERA domain-containing protein n=2 Tax=Bionectria ochroleuca TaxID=29856 RepID=A0A0B7JMC9_BIOOC|nr:unnamed protein product [Clonostachys rosea f. rosea IK726]